MRRLGSVIECSAGIEEKSSTPNQELPHFHKPVTMRRRRPFFHREVLSAMSAAAFTRASVA
jgi:hypothetical protein